MDYSFLSEGSCGDVISPLRYFIEADGECKREW